MSNNDSQKDGELPDAGQVAPRMEVNNPARSFGSRTFGSFSLASPSCTEPGGAPISGYGPDAAGCSRR
jgi:hypothetical protein